MPENVKNQSHYSVDCHDIVNAVEFCPYDWSADLLAIVMHSRIAVGTCSFQDDSSEEGIFFTHLHEFQQKAPVTALAWSPESSLLTIPRVIKFCTAALDNKLRLFSADLKNDFTCVDVQGHTNFINDVAYEPDRGERVLSVSDDHTCRIWTLAGEQEICLPLLSPGTAVCWLAQDPAKIMVAEKRGVIGFYNIETQQRIMSLDCGESPLLAADWCCSNLLKVAAIAGSNCFQFDTSTSSQALDNRQISEDGGTNVKYARSHDHLLATVASPGSQIKIINTRTKQTLHSLDLLVVTNVSWHMRIPLMATGGDKKVHFFLAETIAK